ncbi:tetratricopeptide repeat protein [Roseiconus lacunae]|uniref:tetratricopeptide repeat protein n=1 Tax=Roseiconus lacunae TaxID=2605694 RepID=UPI001E3D9899|nr:tetratricopeptide repeat protein [Roseiconus lacunae]MCD0459401.1 tetratricopeptide repeat protein [Roseiconus lacunae]
MSLEGLECRLVRSFSIRRSDRRTGALLITTMLGVSMLFPTAAFAQQTDAGAMAIGQGDETDAESDEQRRERITAERFLTVLLRRPTRGTALDRIFSYHIGRGDIGEVIERLESEASEQSDGDAAGRYHMVIGLLQLQRSEDAAAVAALRKASALLPDNAFAANYLGEAYLLVGQEEKAAEAFVSALAKNPPKQEYLKIAGTLGRLHQRAGRETEALQVWKDLEQAFPGDQRVRERIARILVEEGDFAGALERYDNLAEQARSDNDKIVFAMRSAELRIRAGQKEQAIKQIESLISKLRPGSYLHGEARRQIESAFLANGDYAGMAEYYDQWISDHPDDIDAIVRLARTLSVQGRIPEAIEWFEKAIQRAPSETEPRLALIDAYVAAERYSDAAKQFESLSELDPDNPDHLVRWGQIILEDKDTDKKDRAQSAAKVWMRLAESRSDDAVVQSQVADLLRGAELTELALERYQAAIDLAPQDPQYKEYLGEYLHKLDRKDEAVEVWNSLAAGDLRTRENLVRLAEIFNQFDREVDALKIMAEACQMDPTIDQRLRYAQWLRTGEQYDDAIKQVELAAELSETLEDAERVFAEEVKTYQAAGKLEERIAELRKVVEADPKDSTTWRRLAVLYNAAQQPFEATDAIETSISLTPDSVESLVIAAQMYEDSGRLKDAIEKRRQLADSDSRFRSGHLQKLATLFMQIGERDRSMEVGDELLASSGGSVDSFRFYADLCGRLGKIDTRLDSLRRCVRMNPRSIEAQRMLADQLAEDFKTDQAIELYWQMLDGSDEVEDRRQVVEKLADLYLRSNRLDQLISRLEIRGRESGDRRTMNDLVATAYTQVGDIGLARQILESMLQENGSDTMLLERLVDLAQQAGEFEEALRLQRHLTRLSPDRKNEAMLATLLLDTGALTEAEAIWMKMSESSSDPKQLSRNLNRLLRTGEIDLAIKLAKKTLENDSENWEVLLQLMVLQATEADWEAAAETADRLVGLDLPDDTLPEGGKPYQKMQTYQGQTYPNPPIQYARISSMYSFYRLVDDRYGSSVQMQLPTPMDLGNAKMMGRYCQIKHASVEGDLDAIVKPIKEKALADDATEQDVWDAYVTESLVSSVKQETGVSYQDPATWDLIWRLSKLDPETGNYLLGSFLSTRSRNYKRDNFNVEPMPEERLQWLKEKAESDSTSEQDFVLMPNMNWLEFYVAELNISGRNEESKRYAEQFVSEVAESVDSKNINIVLQQMGMYGTDDQLWNVISKALEERDRSNPAVSIQRAVALIGLFTNPTRVTDGLSEGMKDESYRTRLFELVNQVIEETADEPLRQRTITLTQVGGPRSSYRMVGSSYRRITIEFPPQGLGPSDALAQQLYQIWEQLSEQKSVPAWIEFLEQQVEQAEDPSDEIWKRIALASVWQWQEKSAAAAEVLDKAVERATEHVPMLEPELRLMTADLLLRDGNKRGALKAIDSISVYDRQTMAVREFAAARLGAAIGDADRAKVAARRLFGVRLNASAQIELAKLMGGLGMKDLAADLVRRMRNRGGSNTEQLQSIMTFFFSQKQNDQAAEVAMELLRRSTPTRQRSNFRTVEQSRRTSALQMLANTGRLMDLIERTEQRFKNSPNSSRIRMELSEMYDAAGQKAKAINLLADTDVDKVNNVQALAATAKQLVQAGKMSEACDAYLKLLRRDQSSFNNDFYDIKRPFENKHRMGELADLMMEVGIGKFTSYRAAEICRDLAQDEATLPKAKQLFEAILDESASGSNWNNALSRVSGYSSRLLESEKLVQKMANAMVNNAKDDAGYGTLFDGYSTGSDGRHNNATTYLVRHIADKPEMLKIVEQSIRDQLQENDDWAGGKIWLGLTCVASKQYDEAIELLAPAVEENASPAPTYDMIWLVGSYIDTFDEMSDVADSYYQKALTLPSNRRGSEFRYTLEARYCNFLSDHGRKEEARKMAMVGIKRFEKNESGGYSDTEYEAYRSIRNAMSMMEFFGKLGYPADGLRYARNFDRTLFVKAGRYANGRREQFETAEKKLLDNVMEQGGLQAARSLINPSDEDDFAVDFIVSTGSRPFTEMGLSSVWLDIVRQAIDDEGNTDDLQAFEDELSELANERPTDDSVAAAKAMFDGLCGNPETLRTLLKRWTATPNSGQSETEGEESTKIDRDDRRELVVIIASLLLESAEETDQALLMSAFDSVLSGDANRDCIVLAELGKAFLRRDDKKAAEASWTRVVGPELSQFMMLDLSLAAVNNDMLDLSEAAFDAAIDAPEKSVAIDAVKNGVKSLGDLFGVARQSTSSPSSNVNQRLDAEEVRLAKRIMELELAWRKHKLWTTRVYDPWVRLVLPAGKPPRPLCIDAEVKDQNRVVVDSAFDRLAMRVHWSNKTDDLLGELTADDAITHLLATLVLLRGERGPEANTRLEKIAASDISTVSKEVALQTLTHALNNDHTRKTAVQLSLALLNANRPTQRYQDIEPFDHFALQVAKVCLDKNLEQQSVSQAINDYLELTSHDNDRYSGGTYQLTRRKDQLEEVAKLLLPTGRTDQALLYLGMRAEAFNQGLDTSLDWVGCWALESLQGMQDHAVAYRMLADWTFSGDGALQNIQTLARRQPLPDWIPPDVGGHYPPFPPVVDQALPIATNYHFLTRLAQETGMRQDLLDRLAEAQSKERVGADVALAIALAAFEMEIDNALIAKIETRLKQRQPGNNRPKSRIPLAEMQLASMIAHHPTHTPAAKRVTEMLLDHTHSAGRGFLKPWISRYQWKQGWAESSSWKTADEMEHWAPATIANAHARHDGKPTSIWVTDGRGQISHVAGYGHDYLWFKYPLEGNYEIQMTSQDGGYRESSLVCDGLELMSNGSSSAVYANSDGSNDWVRHYTKALNKNGLNVNRMVRDDDHTSHYANDQLTYQEARRNSMPFVGFSTSGDKKLTISGIKITGEAKIPRQVSLISDEDMRGWTATYFNMPLPTSGINMKQRDKEAAEPRSVRKRPRPDDLSSLSWTVNDGEIISGELTRHGHQEQDCLQYQRPLCDGETLRYEFLYEKDKIEVHPTIGRVAYMLREDGCKLHLMNSGNTSWHIPQGYEVPVPGVPAKPIKLNDGDWNEVTMKRDGNRLTLSVNGEVVFAGVPETRDGSQIFGFFRDSKDKQVRIRNVVLSGDWPETIPENLFSTSRG